MFIPDWSQNLPKQGKDIVDLVNSQSLFSLLQVPYKPKAHSGPLGQLNLSKAVLLPFLFNMFR